MASLMRSALPSGFLIEMSRGHDGSWPAKKGVIIIIEHFHFRIH